MEVVSALGGFRVGLYERRTSAPARITFDRGPAPRSLPGACPRDIVVYSVASNCCKGSSAFMPATSSDVTRPELALR